MTDPTAERLSCPGCGKGYRWQAALVGREVPCKQCGDSFGVPDAPGVGVPIPPANDDSVYALDLDEEQPDTPTPAATPSAAMDGKCPSCNSPVKTHAVLCLNCGFHMAEGRRVETAVMPDIGSKVAPPALPGTALNQAQAESATRASQRAAYDREVAEQTLREHRWEEYHRPLILLGVGLVFVLINALALTPAVNGIYTQQGMGIYSTGSAIAQYAIVFGMTLVMMTPLLLGGIFFMAAVFGSAFGNLYTAVFKLVSMVVLIVGLDHLIALNLDLITGGLGAVTYAIRLAIVFGVFYPTAAKVFDMESHEISVMFLLYVIGPMAIGLLAEVIMQGYF